jgi:hypothetical protein
MRRSLTTILIASCVLLTNLSPVYSAVKPGDACKKLGQTSTSNGYKYSCVKSGKKLVWSKGVKLPTPKPIASPSAVATPSPSAVATPSPSVVATPTPTPSVTVKKPLSLDNLDYKEVYLASRTEVSKYVANGFTNDGAINFQVGENVEPWRVEIAKNEINSAVKLWSSFFKPTSMTIIWYSSKDIDWAKAKYEAAGGNPAWARGFSGCSAQYCGNASASLMGGTKFLFEQGLEFKDQGLWNRSTAAHEYSHLAQFGLSSPTNLGALPWWSVEGGAQFYGEAIGYDYFDSSRVTRSGMHSQYAADSQAYISTLFPGQTLKSVLQKNDPDATKILMKSIEATTSSPGALGLSYLLGSYATEVLVSVYGHEKMANFYVSFATSADYQSNFEKVFGISLDTFYLKLTPYLLSMAAELK